MIGTINEFEAMKSASESWGRQVVREWLLALRQRFPSQETGPPVSWALPLTRQREYLMAERTIEIYGQKEVDSFQADLEKELNAIMDELVNKAKLIADAGGTELRLVWRLKEQVQVSLTNDLAGARYLFKLRTRYAFTTLNERILEERKKRGDVGAAADPLDPPRARLYTEEQILEIRTMESRAAAIGTHGEYTRIPLTGLYVKTNCWLLRQFRRLKNL